MSEHSRRFCMTEHSRTFCMTEHSRTFCISEHSRTFCKSENSRTFCISEHSRIFCMSEYSRTFFMYFYVLQQDSRLERKTTNMRRSCPRLASIMLTNEGPPETHRTSQHGVIEGFKGGPHVDPHYTESRKSLGQSIKVLAVWVGPV